MPEHVQMRLDPWFDDDEWNHVKNLVLSKDLRAIKFFQVWRSRSPRLPAGIETTCALLEASLQMDNSLTISMAINRFLNHISHIGMNVWGVRKLHDAAERLKLPSWIVDIRHETTHGHMPSLTILQASYEVCWSWLCTNYWNNIIKDTTESAAVKTEKRKVLTNLLECYLYLRVYLIWGTAHVRDIAENRDVYSHMKKLWLNNCSAKLKDNFDQLTVKQALAVIKSDISRLDVDPLVLASVLVDEELLVPETSFCQALLADGEEEDADHVEIPKELLTVWREFIQKIDAKVGAKVLIDHLVARTSRSNVDETTREFCAAWVVEISDGMLGHSAQLTLSREHGCTLADLETWISKPNRLVRMMLPCFASLSSLDEAKHAALDTLMSAAVGDNEDEDEKDFPQKTPRKFDEQQLCTVEHIIAQMADTPPTISTTPAAQPSQSREEGWKKVQKTHWSSDIVLRIFPEQTWQSGWLPSDADWLPTKQQLQSSMSEDEENYDIVTRIPQFECDLVVWPGNHSATKVEVITDAKPMAAFYRTGGRRAFDVKRTHNKQFPSPRRKRAKRN